MSLKSEMKNVVDIQGTLCLPIRIFFEKTGSAKYMSHLDLMRCMTRTIRRAGVPIWYTEGFNPHPFMTFAMPLSLGTAGLCETMDVRLTDSMSFEEVKNRLNNVLCEGIKVTKVDYQKFKATEINAAKYKITLAIDGVSGETLCGKLSEYLSQNEIIVQKKNKKKQLVDIDIKPHIMAFSVKQQDSTAVLNIKLPSGTGLNINPNIILKGFSALLGRDYDVCNIVRERILTESGEDFA